MLQASPTDRKLCRAILDLKKVAKATHAPQQVGIVKDEPMTVACERRDDAGKAFCNTAISSISIEFTHAFPWQVRGCLVDWGLSPQIDTADQYTGLSGRKKITHLSADWRDGTRIELHFVARGDFGDGPEYKDYWGVYRLDITPR